MIKQKFSEAYQDCKEDFIKTINYFDEYSQTLGNTSRNLIKIVSVRGKEYTIKSFKIPNLINQLVYRFFRKSKAQRSFEYATKLLSLGLGTPNPVGYQQYESWVAISKSYYISEYILYDLTYRELTTDLDIEDHEQILRAFTRFTFDLHENGVNFLDHSPGNTLIKRKDGAYKFYLVDLNRMRFESMDFKTRIKNFAKLTIHESMVKVMSDEYATCIGGDKQQIFDLMWKYTCDFQERYHRRRRIKKKVFFWRKKYRQAG